MSGFVYPRRALGARDEELLAMGADEWLRDLGEVEVTIEVEHDSAWAKVAEVLEGHSQVVPSNEPNSGRVGEGRTS